MAWSDTARTRREVIRGALKGTAYAAPVVLAAVVPRAVAAASPITANLSLTKSVDTAAPTVGTPVTFTLLVNNLGPAPATGVVVTDPLPAGLTFVSSSTLQGSYAAATGLWTIGTLAAGARATLTLVATAATAGAKVNTATVRAEQGDPDLTNNSASVTVTPGVSADLGLMKTVDKPTPNVGDIVTFTLTLTNGGPNAATGVTVTDLLPAGLTFLSATPSGTTTYNAATGLWTVGSLANTASATLFVRATVAQSGIFLNTATVSHSDQPDPRVSNNTASATVTTTAADLALAKVVNNPTPDILSTVTFTLTLTNGGPNAATGVTVTDTLPAGLTFVSSLPSQGTYNAGTGVWTVGGVANGATATLAITATVGVAALPSVTNTATISHSDQTDLAPGNNTASATVTPRAADIEVTKALGNEAPVRGETLTFQVVAWNRGPNDATGVVVHDAIPANLGGGAVTAVEQGSYDPGTGDWTIGTLTSGQAVSLFLQGSYDGAITNTATRTASSPPDPDPTNDSATVNVPAPVP